MSASRDRPPVLREVSLLNGGTSRWPPSHDQVVLPPRLAPPETAACVRSSSIPATRTGTFDPGRSRAVSVRWRCGCHRQHDDDPSGLRAGRRLAVGSQQRPRCPGFVAFGRGLQGDRSGCVRRRHPSEQREAGQEHLCSLLGPGGLPALRSRQSRARRRLRGHHGEGTAGDVRGKDGRPVACVAASRYVAFDLVAN